MKKIILILGLLSLTSVSFAGVCKQSLKHTIVPTGSQTIVSGCDSQKIPYKAVVLTFYRKADMLKSTRIMLDSRDTSNRVKAEKALGRFSKELSKKIQSDVLSELKLALDSTSEAEKNEHIEQGTENLKRILTE